MCKDRTGNTAVAFLAVLFAHHKRYKQACFLEQASHDILMRTGFCLIFSQHAHITVALYILGLNPKNHLGGKKALNI